MPGLHLPRAPCNIFVYDCSCIVEATGYDVCFYIILVYDYRAIFVYIIQGLLGTNPYGDCTDIVRHQFCHRTVSVRFSLGKKLTENLAIAARSSRGRRTGIAQCQYDMSTGYGLTVLKACINKNYIQNRRCCGIRESVRYRTSVATSTRRPYKNGVTGSVDTS